MQKKTYSPSYSKYKRRLQSHHKKIVKEIRKKNSTALVSLKNNSLGALGGALMLTSSVGPTLAHNISEANSSELALDRDVTKKNSLLKVQELLSSTAGELKDSQVDELAKELSRAYGYNFTNTINGNKLNTNWGYFGQEQHLYRWKGDTLGAHIEELDHGMAPGKGAFGYFDNAEQEKYYIATQLHLIPDWNDNWSTLKPFYRYRKVLVYNPNNNKAAIAVIGDAGPAKWTGKDFGGSPELMAYLNMYDGSQKSKALVLLLDDPNYDNIPLGPLTVDDSSKFVSSIL